MKKIILLFSSLFSLAFSAQDFRMLTNNKSQLVISHSLKKVDFKYTSLNSKEWINFAKTHSVTSLTKGAPMLPVFNTSLLIPEKGNVKLVVEYDGFHDIPNVNVLPSKGNLKRNVNPDLVPYELGTEYESNQFYPSSLAILSEPFILRTLRGVTVSFSPYQYNPITKTLRVYENLRARIVTASGEKGINEISGSSNSADDLNTFKNLFLNHTAATSKNANEEEGEMLIICPYSYLTQIQPLANWKNQKGIKTTIATNAGTTAASTKNFIQNFYNTNPNLKFVLLVGDHQQIPAYSYGMSGSEPLWSDSFYGQLNGTDYFPEVFVGRFSGTSTEVGIMVNRTLEYEKNPGSGNWMQNAVGIGSNEGAGYGDDGEADYQHLRNIRTKLMNYGFNTVHEFYQGSQGGSDAGGEPTPSMVSNAINTGAGLLNYTGHGDRNLMVTSDFTSSDVQTLTNTGKYPFVVSVACNNGTFTELSGSATTSLGESFLRKQNGGAIAFTGSSILMSWAPPMQTQDEMTEFIIESYPANKKTTLGGLFYNSQVSMLTKYPAEGPEVMQTWIFFGDPSATYRSKISQNITVTHPSTVSIGASSLNISCNTPGAVVAISQNNVFLGKGVVDSNGTLTLNFPMLSSPDALMITATKQNYIPYQAPITVSALSIEEEHIPTGIYPNPAKDFIYIKGIDISKKPVINIYDKVGRLVISNAEMNNEGKINISILEKGNYILEMVISGKQETTKLIVE
ncbi:gingipain R [Chryseobacterium defluvii]|uniref:Gingipain R n=1 Tax=Chryseobacterium defluvii TaxID=160396 RepID=A0A840KN43_9FLAO|nr:C25 family cysteine peptidase [Chryseobacterium defluvii]MBB4808252.1 gingipain R [Chryseobacterium defluvii]